LRRIAIEPPPMIVNPDSASVFFPGFNVVSLEPHTTEFQTGFFHRGQIPVAITLPSP